ncbi:unnamed protein product [Rotaria magnacalcarata]|uniref:UBC core domain-containing protein n=2 Tax=Rotaria magnacalcarata TaxID=392030 RepID=A0A816YY06_9BILA|nr:unnamed protein product [Rotaria magnacalcarata]
MDVRSSQAYNPLRRKNPATIIPIDSENSDEDKPDNEAHEVLPRLGPQRSVTGGKLFMKQSKRENNNPIISPATKQSSVVKYASECGTTPLLTTHDTAAFEIDIVCNEEGSKRTTLDHTTTDDFLIHIQTLTKTYELKILQDTTVERLIDILWNTLNTEVENCRKESHILLLFNQRMHIFLSDPTEKINEFLKLMPQAPHLYLYAIYRKQRDEMYTYDSEPKKTFAFNDVWWNPVYFVSCIQQHRPQSILLSSLFAIRLLFQKSDNKLNDWGQALEAQFFLHLRKYIFPPAVLALKHAITEGCLFWFEKPLFVDALIQLLKDLCPANVPGHELCDCIPLFLGCLLSQCDVKAPNTDLYKTVNLITLQNSTQQLLQDPATQISHIAGPYELKERTEIRGNAKRHVDIRSLTQHLLNREHYYTICYCKRTDYLIYDSTNSNEVVKKLKIDRLNDEEITKQYKLMAKDYPSLTFITRGALRADIADQLIFLLDRTVALVFKKKTDRRITTTNRTDSKTSVESFEIFNPLQTTVGRTPTITAAQVYDIRNIEDKSQALPIYFTLNTHDEQVDNSLSVVYKNEMPKQITVVLLDRSRSMFEKFASSDLHDKRTIIDMSIIMLGILSDNIISLDHTPAFGLIHFGTSLETVCPITRNQDQFEKSLKAAPAKQEWTYGIDNHSVSSFDDMKTRIKQHSITIDFISFLRDELLQNRERHIVNLIKRLCEETHGYIYQQFPLTHIQLGATFEQEAAVWLIERDTKVFGAVSKPSRQKPLQLEYNAVSKVPNRVPRLTGGVPHYHRVVSEVNDVFNSHLDFIQLFVCRKDIFFWKVIMKGPFGTPYESGLWLLYANFGEEYPRRAPTVRFMTEIYHVNINSDGKICHQIFDRGWASVTTMVDAFTSIFDLLKESNFDDALSIEKTQLKRDQPDEYHRQAIDCTRRCAHKNLHELKLQFQLED